MSRILYTWNALKNDLANITRDMANDDWRPDVIVGVARGGNVPAVMLSHYYDANYKSIKVQFRDRQPGQTSIVSEMTDFPTSFRTNKTNVLVVDDINDSGQTFQHIKTNLEKITSFDQEHIPVVKYAALVDNIHSCFTVDYSQLEINKEEDPSWIVFPWEEWWT